MTTDSTDAAPATICPQCGAPVPPSAGYVVWCDLCDWNVDPSPSNPPATPRDRTQQERNRREAERTRDHAAGIEPLTVGERVALVVPVLIAVAVLVLTAMIFVSGIAAIVAYPWVVGIPLGFIFMTLALMLRPRLGRMPRGPSTLRREDAPEVFALLDEICGAARAKPIDLVVMDGEFNAAAGKVGLRRRQVVYIGIPLWLALEPQPRVAVLGHEVGHFVNGDLRRSLLVGSSMRTLAELVDALSPVGYIDATHGFETHGGFDTQLRDAVLALVALPLRGLLSVQLRLTLRSHRAAEHDADLLGATIASTAAMVDALDSMQLESSCMRALDHADRDDELWDRIRTWRAELPPREHERLRRLGRLQLACADSTHPPTAYRIDALQARDSGSARVTLDAPRAARIEAELLEKSRDVARTLGSTYR